MASKGLTPINLDSSPEEEINTESLQFQDIPYNNKRADKKGKETEQIHVFTNFPNPDDSEEDSAKTDLLTEEKKSPLSFWSFEYYQQFFDVDTYDVLRRLFGSFIPKPKTNFLTHQIRPNPDLYGPFWICVTLVFTMAVAGNFANYIQFAGSNSKFQWKYDFHKVTTSAAAIFAYWWLVPTVLWVLFWRRGNASGISFLEMICIYGYSLTIYIPVSILWVIQFTWLQWLLVLIALCLSGSVLVLTFWPALREDSSQLAVVTSSIIFLLHGLLAVGFMLFFFYVPSSSNTITTPFSSTLTVFTSPSSLAPISVAQNTTPAIQ